MNLLLTPPCVRRESNAIFQDVFGRLDGLEWVPSFPIPEDLAAQDQTNLHMIVRNGSGEAIGSPGRGSYLAGKYILEWFKWLMSQDVAKSGYWVLSARLTTGFRNPFWHLDVSPKNAWLPRVFWASGVGTVLIPKVPKYSKSDYMNGAIDENRIPCEGRMSLVPGLVHVHRAGTLHSAQACEEPRLFMSAAHTLQTM